MIPFRPSGEWCANTGTRRRKEAKQTDKIEQKEGNTWEF